MKKKTLITIIMTAVIVAVMGIVYLKLNTGIHNTKLETVENNKKDQIEFTDFSIKINDLEIQLPQKAEVLKNHNIDISGDQIEKDLTIKRTVNYDGSAVTVFLHNFSEETVNSEDSVFSGYAASSKDIGTINGALIGKSKKTDIVDLYGNCYTDIADESGNTGFEYEDTSGNVARFFFDKDNVLSEIVMLNLNKNFTGQKAESAENNVKEDKEENTKSYVETVEPSKVEEYTFPEKISNDFNIPQIQLYEEGMIYQFPMPVENLITLGWSLVNEKSYLDPNGKTDITISNGSERITLGIYNPENEPVSEMQAWITTITFGEGGVPGSDITINGKIKIGISEETLLSLMENSGLKQKEIPLTDGKYISYYTEDEKNYYRFKIKDKTVTAVTLDIVM